jgi:hypothetical protein
VLLANATARLALAVALAAALWLATLAVTGP